MTLIQAMQRRPPVTRPDATLRSAARQMASHGSALLPVIADDRLVGTLSAFDLTARSLGGDLDPDRRTVRALMRPDTPTCRPEDGLDEVRVRMLTLRMPTLPVTEPGAHLVGLVHWFDIEGARESSAGPEPELAKRVRGEAL